MENRDEIFMKEAVRLAKYAAEIGEVPVGAIVVFEDKIIASAYNRRECDKCSTHHAEIMAIEEACRVRGGWRLFGCELFVTMEPCAMCAGAIVNSRIDRVVFGAPDLRFGAVGSLFDINSFGLNHKFTAVGGVLEEECKELLQTFFRQRR